MFLCMYSKLSKNIKGLSKVMRIVSSICHRVNDDRREFKTIVMN